jgi:hypothetical protein
MIFWSIFSGAVGVIAAIGLVACFSRTERSKSGNYNPQALSVIGSALLSTFILVTAFLIAGSWATYNADRQHTYDEARSATVAYWLAGKLPAADAANARQGLTNYVDMVVKDEWPLMGEQQSSNATWSELDQLRTTVAAMHPADAAGEKKRADLAAALDDLYSKRSIRVADANYSMPGILYAALIVAALLLLAYPPLVGMTGNVRNVTLLAGFGAMIGLGIYIVYALSHAFAQPLAISPNAYKQALDRFAQIASGKVG